MIRQAKVSVFILLSWLLTACGSSLDVPSIAELTNFDREPTVVPTPTVTELPSLRTLLPADMTATANATLPPLQNIITATPNPNATLPPPTATATATPADVRRNVAEAAELSAEDVTATPPTPTPEPSPTPTPLPATLTLRTPSSGSQFIAGTGIDVSGTASGVTAGQLIRVALVNEQGGQIADVTLIASEGDWRVILPVPAEITGQLFVEAKITAANGVVSAETTAPIEAIGDIAVSEIPDNDYFIAIDRASTQAVAGKGVFLNGRSGSPLDVYDVTMEIYYQDCTLGAGPISFQMFGSGGWNGYLIVPSGTQGSTICVRAFTGTPGTDSYREAEERFVVVDALSVEARSVEIAVPRPGSYYTSPFEVSGFAINPPLGYVLVQVLAQSGDVLWQNTIYPDRFGNWSATVEIESDGPLPVSIAAIVDNTDGTYLTDQHSINLEPFFSPD